MYVTCKKMKSIRLMLVKFRRLSLKGYVTINIDRQTWRDIAKIAICSF